MREYLDIREINGYSIQYTPFHVSEGHDNDVLTSINCLVYIGLPDNPQFLGPQDPQALAKHILESRGPSGKNKVRHDHEERVVEAKSCFSGLFV